MPNTRVVASVVNVSVAAANGTIVPDIDIASFDRIHVDVTLSGLAGGTAPAVTFTVERQDANGIWRVLFAFAAQNANGSLSRSIGPALETSLLVPARLRVTWATTGAPSAAVGAVSIIGDTTG